VINTLLVLNDQIDRPIASPFMKGNKKLNNEFMHVDGHSCLLARFAVSLGGRSTSKLFQCKVTAKQANEHQQKQSQFPLFMNCY